MQKYQQIIGPLLTIFVCSALLQTNFFTWLSDENLDILFKIRGERQTSQSIIIIGIDESSLEELGSWPFPRHYHAELLNKLAHAKAIGFDLIFSLDDEDDQIFADAMIGGPPIVMAAASDYRGQLLAPTGTLNKYTGLGHIETELGLDGVVRRVDLVKLGLPVLALAVTGQEEQWYAEYKTEQEGKLINFYGPEFTFLYISYIDVLSGKYKPEFFKDRYVLVGSKALALGDVHITPFSQKHPVPGVEIQATILNNLLDQSYIRESNQGTVTLCILYLLLATLFWPKQSEAKNIIGNIGLVLAAFIGAVYLFHLNIFIKPLIPIFVICICYLLHVVVQWATLTTRMVREIRLVNDQLEHGIQTVFQSLPSSIDKELLVPHKLPLVGPGGLKRHVLRMHHGISALALQNSFIQHLLSEEAPPLVIWQKEGGKIILANYRFMKLWEGMDIQNGHLPDLEEFNKLIDSKGIGYQENDVLKEMDGFDSSRDRAFDICVREKGQKVFLRIVVNEVNSTILGWEGILASFTDVTEIRELERLKGEMMNIVSHELKLPLTTILGFSEMLADSLIGVEQQYADEISKQSKRLAKMIEDFLHIARIESGRYIINRYPFDLLSVVYDAISVVEPSALKKSIEIICRLPQKISPLVGDETLITQVVLNLLDNAVKFSPHDSEVTLRIIEKKDELLLSICDEGPGIKDEEKTKIFGKFVRGGGEVKGSGFGLGLSFVQQVIENHGGNIIVEDGTSVGSVFTLTIPKVVTK